MQSGGSSGGSAADRDAYLNNIADEILGK